MTTIRKEVRFEYSTNQATSSKEVSAIVTAINKLEGAKKSIEASLEEAYHHWVGEQGHVTNTMEEKQSVLAKFRKFYKAEYVKLNQSDSELYPMDSNSPNSIPPTHRQYLNQLRKRLGVEGNKKKVAVNQKKSEPENTVEVDIKQDVSDTELIENAMKILGAIKDETAKQKALSGCSSALNHLEKQNYKLEKAM